MKKCICVLLLGLFATASTQSCEKDGVMPCYDNLTYYDERQFPSRGVGEHQLEEICTNWNESLDCVEYFTSVCNHHPNCDQTCQVLINKMIHFVDSSGLREVKYVLCDEENEMRHAYIKDSDCLNGQMGEFDVCRKIWDNSYDYVMDITDMDEKIKKGCCAASFYKGCIINATQGICELEATNVVRYIFDTFFWSQQVRVCEAYPVCDTPLPIPPKSSSPPLAKPYSSWPFMYFIFMFMSVFVIKY